MSCDDSIKGASRVCATNFVSATDFVTYSEGIQDVVRANCLFVLSVAKFIRLLGKVAKKVHTEVTDELLGLLMDACLLGQLLHNQLLDRGLIK